MGKVKVVIVSMTAGSGHIRAAKALLDYSLSNLPFVSCKYVNFSERLGAFNRFLDQNIYEFLSKKFPFLWDFYYNLTDSFELALFLSKKIIGLQSLFQGEILKSLIEENPDLVIFTNPIPAALFSGKIRRISKKTTMALIATDYRLHAIYNIKPMDYYFVPCGEAKYDLEKMGIDPEKIFISGIPINPRFYFDQDVLALKNKYKIKPNKKTVLFITASLPKKIVKRVLEVLDNFNGRFNVLLITPFNWTDVIDEHMKMADVVLSKPGGLISSECMALGKELFIVGLIPGVETSNARFMEKNGYAKIIGAPEKLKEALEKILNEGESPRRNPIYKKNPAETIFNILTRIK